VFYITIVINMKNLEENQKKTLQLGAIEHDLCLRFRIQASERKLAQIKILNLLIEWWISLDELSQRNFYFQDRPLPDIVREHVEKIMSEYGLVPKIDKGKHGIADPGRPDARNVASRVRAQQKDHSKKNDRKKSGAG